ncbi:Snurportin-1 [Caenorhabditis elegans]|uniref:Snurportin-1 n=1 Tax=Caenorhabditis elegans TaxID=6239 RepID=O17066_CAEEL|nr:Snurportin-1 [Caenorhabditis elegans]CCD62354.1 Snurportin-1 [Caenorhabditis elegans]|eukprot:NP_493639.1 Snurportin-1 [Caenorhabditis elegans]
MGDDLDSLTDQLSSGFQVDPLALGEHPRYSQYKNLTKAAEQQAKRREETLERQKNGRFDTFMKLRNLAFDDVTSDEDDEQKIETTTAEKHTGKFKKYADKMMLSEWLVDIPESLSSDWTMVMAPVGKRTLVVASRGFTVAYNKGGREVSRFQSRLPGGNTRAKNQAWTILDCIYSNQTYYVLDLLSWNAHEYVESPYDFRQFMLKSKLEEAPELAKSTPGFRNIFSPIPSCPCSQDQMAELMKNEISFRLDGLLFYHNSVVYQPGQSPLVGWLKPWMLPEILNVPVPEKYKAESNGQSSSQFIESFNQKHKHQSKIDRSMEH